ncbi:MAG: hypothetical protein K9M55_05855 [Candidatus Marinimicrobia bacterium]|nr:hypothetical protein [Candidatus Neomarinimicrobiota bacterium]MCF7922208.1 hypothetical protein [Candidatus Neomarinimicrobiota bacterium]
MNLKDMVKGGQKVRIRFYSRGSLWYITDSGFEFPVPVGDRKEVGNATFLAEDKAIYFMRYIRKHIQFLDDARLEAQGRS